MMLLGKIFQQRCTFRQLTSQIPGFQITYAIAFIKGNTENSHRYRFTSLFLSNDCKLLLNFDELAIEVHYESDEQLILSLGEVESEFSTSGGACANNR